jgi:tetratricopeptide (TPR) repeat protein
VSLRMMFPVSVGVVGRGRVLAVAGVLGVAAAAGAAGGCADLVTYASESRQEGIKRYNDGQYPEAIGAFAGAIKQRPQDYQSYYYLGRTHEAMKNYHSAVKEYRTALRVMDASLAGRDDGEFRDKVLDGLAAAVAAGNSVELEQAAFAPTGTPSTPEQQFVLAKVRRLQRDVDSALDLYAKAGAADPKNFAIAKEHGLLLLQLNQRSKASQELRRAYVLNARARRRADQQIEDGLRRIDVVPGPSLGEEGDLAKPVIPHGPLPEPQWSRPDGSAPPQDQASTVSP